MKRTMVVLGLSWVAGCASINPAMKQQTDSMIAQYKSGQALSVPAPSSYEPAPWKVGQWVVFSTVHKGEPSVTKMSVVGKEARGTWVETAQQDYHGVNITKILYSHQPTSKEDAADTILLVVSKRNEEAAQTTDFAAAGPMGGLLKGMYRSVAANLQVRADPSTSAKETVTVAAGNFAGALKYAGSYSFGPFSGEVTGHYHPAVPLMGLVKSSTPDGETTTELLGFGDDGAKSQM